MNRVSGRLARSDERMGLLSIRRNLRQWSLDCLYGNCIVVCLTVLFLISPLMAWGVSQADEASLVKSNDDRNSSIPADMKQILAESTKILGTCDLRLTIDRKYLVPDLPRPIKEDHDFYLNEGKFRHHLSAFYPAKDSLVQTTERAFDGRVFYLGGWNGEGVRSLKRYLGDNPEDLNAKYLILRYQYLETLGVELPQTVAGWKDFSLTSVLLKLINEAESFSIENGEGSLLKLTLQVPEPTTVYAKSLNLDEMESFYRDRADDSFEKLTVRRYRQLRAMNLLRKVELWVDPTKGYAIKRSVDSTPDGKLIRTMDCEKFEFTGSGHLWIPRTSTIRSFLNIPELLDGFAEEPEQTDIITMQQFGFDPRSEVSFEISYGPGAFITDRSTVASREAPDGAMTYVEPSDVSALRDAANRAQPRFSIVLIINVLLILLLVGIVVWRWRV